RGRRIERCDDGVRDRLLLVADAGGEVHQSWRGSEVHALGRAIYSASDRRRQDRFRAFDAEVAARRFDADAPVVQGDDFREVALVVSQSTALSKDEINLAVQFQPSLKQL